MGLFHAFLNDASVKMIGVEAGGRGLSLGEHAARFLTTGGGRVGVLQGTRSYVLQDTRGQVSLTHSVSAGLDYASVGPEHALLHDMGRATYSYASDAEALEAFQLMARMEGILPALESSHAIAEVVKLAPKLSKDEVILMNLSGRGDKDVNTVAAELNVTL
jgi:tryptophan synthase beta chain